MFEYLYARTSKMYNGCVLILTEISLLDCEKRIYNKDDPCRGEYPFVLQVNKKDHVKELIQKHFENKNDFYDNNVCDKIIPFLQKNKIKFKQLGEREKECLVRGLCYFEDGASEEMKRHVKKSYDEIMSYYDKIEELQIARQKEIEKLFMCKKINS